MTVIGQIHKTPALRLSKQWKMTFFYFRSIIHSGYPAVKTVQETKSRAVE